MKKYITIILLALTGGYLGSYVFHLQNNANSPSVITSDSSTAREATEANEVPQNVSDYGIVDTRQNGPAGQANSEDFVEASKVSTQSVVYIKNISSRVYRQSFMDMFFGLDGQTSQTISSGSGVIFTDDGYIVTNNHVIADADRIEVVHGKNSYDAELIGTDPSSDLAVLKVDAKNLPAIPVGSSKELQVGEWVIAVGNPFNLTSTVTGGIVSAKARALHIVKDKFPLESFIQTDAAINPGNSGGALVNIKGELVGINTAILSRTGSYAGYGFAVPVDIVKKIVGDIVHYGEVQKAFIGADVNDLNDDIANRLSLDLDDNQGVVVIRTQNSWAADKAGIKENDIIISVDDEPTNSKAEFDELISYHSPGDKIHIKWKSGKKIKEADLTLTNRDGTTEILETKVYTSEYLGADLEVVSKLERDLYDIEHGVKVTKLYSGGLLNRLDLEEGFIVTNINEEKIDTAQSLADILSKAYGRVRIEGVSKSGRKGYYSFYLR
ncbi:MAG: trypsin-like peptidase domain-containing protein [Bacteroidota bacterium]